MSNAKGSAKLKVYEECCSKLKPAFHHFFTDQFQDPMSWFSARLAYTRTVATGSIVGWVLGLGDRHVSNILIDVATGEMVHIDFGVAFEQVRRLAHANDSTRADELMTGLLPYRESCFRSQRWFPSD